MSLHPRVHRLWTWPALAGLSLLAVAVPPAVAGTSNQGLGAGPQAGPPATSPLLVTADQETVPTLNAGDSADDPSIWVDPVDPSRSLVIGNDKKGALEVYDLSGARVQRIVSSAKFWGNVDVRSAVTIGGFTGDLVTASNGNGIRAYRVNAANTLDPTTEGTGPIRTGGGEGHCLYAPPTGEVYAFKITRPGRLRQYRLTDADQDGLLSATLVREVAVGSEAEGCVADDERGDLYVSEEDVALWRYGANPGDGSSRVAVDTVGVTGNLVADIEGVTIAHPAGGDVLIASAQNVAAPKKSYFVVYDLPAATYSHSFRIVDGGANADGCTRTDGVAAYAGDLGPEFPQGMFVCQDNNNTAPGGSGNQGFKMTRLERVLAVPGAQ